MKNHKICYIVGAVETDNLTLEKIKKREDDLIIAADGGFLNLQAAGIHPDLVVGDFDSLGFLPDEYEIIRHPVEKDDTDMMLAIKTGIDRGFLNFVIYGALGGLRFEHSLANLQALIYIAEKGMNGYILGDDIFVTVIRNAALILPIAIGDGFSVFSASDKSEGVSIKGSKYNLDKVTLKSSFPIGVSNVCTGDRTEVSVENGVLWVLMQGKPGIGKLKNCQGL